MKYVCADSVISVYELTPDLFNYPDLPHGPGRPKKNRLTYKNVVCAFDIETTVLNAEQITGADADHSIMYIWQFQLGLDYTIIGRTWDEFKILCRYLNRLPEDHRYIIFVHNLSYEWQWLKSVFPFESENVFAMDRRKILKCTYRNLEFRCSYLHTNRGLGKFLKDMSAFHQKTELDYTGVRYPWTELTQKELEYCMNDVRGLVEAIYIEMDHDKDTLYTLPLTSTGYIRRMCKDAMKLMPHGYVKPMIPSWEVYEMLTEAFRGGNAHANRFYAGEILEDVHSADRSSSYPDVLCVRKFPVGRWFDLGKVSMEGVTRMIKKGRAVLMRVQFLNLRLRDYFFGCPYLSYDKGRYIRGEILDNGRILSCDFVEYTITDIDLEIILNEYDFDACEVVKAFHTKYGELPTPFVQVITELYRQKTELKGVQGEELTYMKSKNKINSCYGMTAQRPARMLFVYDGLVLQLDEETNIEQEYKKSYYKQWMPFSWGVWCTAWARWELEQMINNVLEQGGEFYYTDTDSVKYFGDVDWTEYNKEQIALAKAHGCYAKDQKGDVHYMGVAEDDGFYAEFVTWGSKRYAYNYEKGGESHVTIAGVNKNKGGAELDRAGGLPALQPDFIFRDAGGTVSYYNDLKDPLIAIVEGKQIPVISNVVIKDSTYEMGLTTEYAQLIDNAHLDMIARNG